MISDEFDYGTNQTRPCAYKTFFVLNSTKHEISKVDKSNLIQCHVLEQLLVFGDSCLCMSNHSLIFKFTCTFKHQ